MNTSVITALGSTLPETGYTMPVLFIGHGSPMNAIENNIFSQTWKGLAAGIPQPAAVIVVSAHWLTEGTAVTAMEHPKTIHDFGGFPPELYQVQYPAPGSPALAAETKNLITSTQVELDHDWGLDHGTWSIIRHMYPTAHIPILQLSIDYYRPAQYHYDLAKQLAPLRKKGVLMVGSGNMVHNLRMVEFSKINEPGFGFDWAHELNRLFKEKISTGDHNSLIHYEKLSSEAKLAVPTPDHYYPLIYMLALQEKNEPVEFFNDYAVGGSLTMTSVKIG